MFTIRPGTDPLYIALSTLSDLHNPTPHAPLCATSLEDRVATKIFEGFGEALFKEFIVGQEPVSTVHYIRPGTCINHPLH